MTVDIDAFLAARYDEAEDLAARIKAAFIYPNDVERDDGTIITAGTPYWPAPGDAIRMVRHPHYMLQLDLIRMCNPDFVLADIAAKRAILAAVAKWKHDYNDEDPWFSCAQAVNPTEPNAEPGSGCTRNCDDEPMPCDCGLDLRRWQILGPLGAPFAGHSDFDPEWSVRP